MFYHWLTHSLHQTTPLNLLYTWSLENSCLPSFLRKKSWNFFLKIPLFFLTFCFLWTFFILVFLIISYNISFFQIFYRGGYSTIQLNANLKTLWFFVHCWYYLFYIFCSYTKYKKIRHVLFSLCIVLFKHGISKDVIQDI